MIIDDRVVSWYRFYLFGRFVMGVSHEVDNYMSVILGFAELLRMNPSETGRVVSSVEKIIKSADSLAHMFKKYSFHVKPNPDDVVVFSAGECLEDLLSFAGYDLRRNGVEIEKNVGSDDFVLKGDRRSFSLMVLNVLINGSEAMWEKGGLLTIELFKDGNRGVIRVRDRGTGIPGHLQEKIFEPFFTTKEENFRLGLGLPVSRYLVEKWNGSLRLSSSEGEGTTFEIFIPLR